MPELSEETWARINAYADGELPPEEAAEIALRLGQDEDLAAALGEVHAAKAALSLMRPAPAPAARARTLPFRRIAMAASVAAVLVAGAVFFSRPEAEDWRGAAQALHAELSAQSYVLAEAAPAPVISTARLGDLRAFDLRGSRLTLVDVQSTQRGGREAVAMHYRGVNGCRVTAVAVEAQPGDEWTAPAPGAGLATSWTVQDIHYALLAGGMDADRFAAIARYAEAESRRRRGADALQLAMRSATDTAQPCV